MSKVTKTEIFENICRLLKPYNPGNRAITLQSGIVTDLEIDSVAVFDLVMALEDHYDISIAMEMVSDIKTVGELVNTIYQLMQA